MTTKSFIMFVSYITKLTKKEVTSMYCTVKEHNGHNHDTVKKVVTKHRNELKEVTALVDNMIEAHDNIEMRKRMR